MHQADFKKELVQKAKGKDLKLLAREYNVSLKSLKRWIQVGPERKKGI
jgi:hypothetical protein